MLYNSKNLFFRDIMLFVDEIYNIYIIIFILLKILIIEKFNYINSLINNLIMESNLSKLLNKNKLKIIFKFIFNNENIFVVWMKVLIKQKKYNKILKERNEYNYNRNYNKRFYSTDERFDGKFIKKNIKRILNKLNERNDNFILYLQKMLKILIFFYRYKNLL